MKVRSLEFGIIIVNPTWREVVSQLIRVGLISDNAGAVAQLVEQI